MECSDSETIMKLRAAVDRIYNGIQKDKFNYFINRKAKETRLKLITKGSKMIPLLILS